MLNGKKVYVIIPARGGSKGIPGKNLYKINGISILERTVILAKECNYVDSIFISTDDDAMYKISKRLCVETRTKRPDYLATDSALTIDVLEHVIKKERAALALLFGGMIFIVAGVNDILYASNSIDSTNLMQLGALGFI